MEICTFMKCLCVTSIFVMVRKGNITGPIKTVKDKINIMN